MAELVAGWSHKGRVHLVERRGDQVTIRTAPARWSMFVEGLLDEEIDKLARDSRVKSITNDGDDRVRIDFKNRWGRREIEEALEGYAEKHERELSILEADVNPVRRVLSDVPALEISPTPRLGYFDLEGDSRHPIRVQLEGTTRILSWALGDIDGVEGLVLEADDDEAERELLRAFFAAAQRFDVLLAWYGDGYDFEALQARALHLGVISAERPEEWHRWCWLDHLECFKKYNLNSDDGGEAKASYALDHVAGYLLGEGKIGFDASKTWEAWSGGPESRQALLDYNIRDVELLPRIEEKTGFVDLHLAVCHICRVFPDSNSLRATQQGDGFLLRLGDEHGYRWATKKHRELDDAFEGAFVMAPTRTGAIDNVHVCDFSGLYPSIIRTWNMSPDTKIDLAGAWGTHVDDSDFGIEKNVEPSGDDLRAAAVCKLPGRDTFFRTDTDGMFRIALDTLVAKRAEYQAEMKRHTPGTPEHGRAKKLQAAFKIVANSFYGIMGSPYSRFFDREIAEGVTLTGQWLLHRVIEEAKNRGLDPFYGDTDSVFVAGDEADMRELVAHMNATWSDRIAELGIDRDAPNQIDLDFEKTFARIILISAKRYAGRFLMYKGKAAKPDAKPEVKGLEFKRGDTIRLAREMQYEIVNALLAPGPLPPSSKARAIVARWKTKLLEEELEPDAVVLSQSLSKALSAYVDPYTKPACDHCGYTFARKLDASGPPKCPECGTERKRRSAPRHIRVARELAEQGVDVKEGDRIRYLIVETPPDSKGKMASEPAQVSDEAFERIDRAYYWDRTYKASARVLEKVYPTEQWEETSAEKRERKKARARVYNRGKINDLPLFSELDNLDAGTGTTEAPRCVSSATKGPRQAPERERPHTCHIPGCDVEVPSKMLMCRSHWSRVPRSMQRDVWQTFNPRQCVAAAAVRPSDAWFAAARAAIDYVLELEGRPRRRAKRTKKEPAMRVRRRKKPPSPEEKLATPPPEKKGPRARRRRKKRQKTSGAALCVFKTQEVTDRLDGGSEQYRRNTIIRRLEAAAAEHPGDVPIWLKVYFVKIYPKTIRSLKTTIELDARIADTPAARAALEKLTTRIDHVKWIAA